MAMPSLQVSQVPLVHCAASRPDGLPRATQLWSRSAALSRYKSLTRKIYVFDTASTRRHCPRRHALKVRSINLGDFGARDPTAKEIESNFGDKVLGNEGTEHVKLIPTATVLGLSERSCKPLPPGTTAMSEDEARPFLRKVVGWRLEKTDTGFKIWTEWKLRDADAAKTLFDRIAAVAEAEEHAPDCRLQETTNVARAELSTPAIGGLSVNDFICASKIDRIKTSDLVKKNRFWA